MAYTLLVENAITRDGFSLAGAVNEFAEFAAGGHDDDDGPVAASAEAEVGAQNEASYQEINALMAGMRFRG